jgi:NAD(P)-dependent dehydrogenase (short-subunit alcohol dehydrogenase family)
VIVVTGSAQGLGRSIAAELAPRSAGMLLVDIDKTGIDAYAERLRAKGHSVETLGIDLTAADSGAAVIAAAEEAFGRADVLVNNAGIVQYADLDATSPGLLRRLLNIDVEAPYFLTQAFASALRSRGAGGCVINLGTSHALVGVAGTSAYAAAKGALHAMTRALAVELAPHGVRVNTLALGTTMTERVRTRLDPELIGQRMRQIPLKRGAEPGEAAQAVAFLVNARFATGTELVLDGGFTVYGDG